MKESTFSHVIRRLLTAQTAPWSNYEANPGFDVIEEESHGFCGTLLLINVEERSVAKD